MTRTVLVIGGGPAGMTAALAAARAGARVVLVESGDQLGGQFWRHRPDNRANDTRLHHGWRTFCRLRDEIDAHPRIDVEFHTQIWTLERESDTPGAAITRVLGVQQRPGQPQHPIEFFPDATVLATGAHDRTLPFPGWTLPGVTTAGAAQAFAKSEGIALGQRVLVAGAGPFLLPVTASLVHSGARVVAVCEANRAGNLSGWLRHEPWKLGRAAHKSAELAEYVALHARHRIPYRLGWAVIAAHGTDRVEAATIARLDAHWRPVPGSERRVACDAICVSHGFTARLELAIAAGCELTPQRFVRVDPHGRTSAPNVFAAGELTAIGGCDAALAEGELAGHCAAGGSADDRAVRGARKRRDTFTRFAAALESAHGIRPGWINWLTPDTVLCRCEETTVGQFRATRDTTRTGALRSLKLTTRAGLGICQGRICGRNVESLLRASAPAEARNTNERPAESQASREGDAIPDQRPIAVPVSLGALSQLAPNRSTPVSHTPPTPSQEVPHSC